MSSIHFRPGRTVGNVRRGVHGQCGDADEDVPDETKTIDYQSTHHAHAPSSIIIIICSEQETVLHLSSSYAS